MANPRNQQPQAQGRSKTPAGEFLAKASEGGQKNPDASQGESQAATASEKASEEKPKDVTPSPKVEEVKDAKEASKEEKRAELPRKFHKFV